MSDIDPVQSSNRVLVLGATGNIGSRVAGALAQRGANVMLRLASSRSSGCDTLRERFPGAEIVQAEWYDSDSLASASAGVDRVFVVTPDFVTDESVVTPNIIRALRAAGTVRQVVRLIAIPPGLTRDKLSSDELATRCGAALHTVARPLLDASGLPMTYVNVPCWMMFNLPWFMANAVMERRKLAMPSATDAARLWVSEDGVAEVIARTLSEPVSHHVGKEYVLTGTRRYTYSQVAALLGEVLGDRVEYSDETEPLEAAMGDFYPKIMTYFGHETRDYASVPIADTIARVLGRPQVTLPDYIVANRALFA